MCRTIEDAVDAVLFPEELRRKRQREEWAAYRQWQHDLWERAINPPLPRRADERRRPPDNDDDWPF